MAITPTTMKTSEILALLNPGALNSALQEEGLALEERNTQLVTKRQELIDELDRRVPIPAP